MGLVDIRTEEWTWCACDFLGKVMFSSSLLHGNFLTIEQRRLIAMRIVEEGNRCVRACAAGVDSAVSCLRVLGIGREAMFLGPSGPRVARAAPNKQLVSH